MRIVCSARSWTSCVQSTTRAARWLFAPTTLEARQRFSERNDMQSKLGTTDRRYTILIIGISRGIGRGLAAEYLRRGWFVIGTVRSSTFAPELEAMAAGMAGRLRVERLDMTRPSEIGTLRERLADDRLDVLIVNAGISDHNVPVAEIDEATFNEVMSTNALAPLKVIESLQDLVVERGTIAVMSSKQGSISLNDRGTYDVYRFGCRSSRPPVNAAPSRQSAVGKERRSRCPRAPTT